MSSAGRSFHFSFLQQLHPEAVNRRVMLLLLTRHKILLLSTFDAVVSALFSCVFSANPDNSYIVAAVSEAHKWCVSFGSPFFFFFSEVSRVVTLLL